MIRTLNSHTRRVFRARFLPIVLLICFISLISIIDSSTSQPYNDQQRAGSLAARLSIFRLRHPETVPVQPTTTPFSMSVLENAIPDTAQHRFQLKDALFPVSDPTRKTGAVWMDENHRRLKALFTCISLENCKPNQGKVVILHSYHFKGGLWGWTGGEDLWARSTILALKNMGYTFLYAEETERAMQLYQLFPDLVVAVLMEQDWATKCFEKKFTCVKDSANPNGIPAWKIFSFYFWSEPNNPLGSRWTLAPEDYASHGLGSNTYLGYSVEPSCMAHEFVQHEERPEGQVYIIAKRLSYFAPHSNPWPLEFFDDAAAATGAKFSAGVTDDSAESSPELEVPKKLPDSIKNHGLLPQDQFLGAIARSRLVIGVGNPALSPTPYEGLCLGVPFINPILSWDNENPSDRTRWNTQHGALKYMDPPYVYNVFKHDKEGFIDAIKQALANPIDRHVLPRMTMPAIQNRLAGILETNWRNEAEAVLLERERNGGQTFTL